jgi:hypothetical protein
MSNLTETTTTRVVAAQTLFNGASTACANRVERIPQKISV